MATQPIPEGQHSITPYLGIKDAARAIDFYKAAFGATEMFRLDAPDGRIGHAELKIGDSSLMLADPCDQAGGLTSLQGNNAASFIPWMIFLSAILSITLVEATKTLVAAALSPAATALRTDLMAVRRRERCAVLWAFCSTDVRARLRACLLLAMAFDRPGVDRPELRWVENGSVFPPGAPGEDARLFPDASSASAAEAPPMFDRRGGKALNYIKSSPYPQRRRRGHASASGPSSDPPV